MPSVLSDVRFQGYRLDLIQLIAILPSQRAHHGHPISMGCRTEPPLTIYCAERTEPSPEHLDDPEVRDCCKQILPRSRGMPAERGEGYEADRSRGMAAACC